VDTFTASCEKADECNMLVGQSVSDCVGELTRITDDLTASQLEDFNTALQECLDSHTDCTNWQNCSCSQIRPGVLWCPKPPPPPECEAGSLDATAKQHTRPVLCTEPDAGWTFPIEITLSAKNKTPVVDDASTDYDVQAQFTITEQAIEDHPPLQAIGVAEMDEVSVDVDDGPGGTSVNVPATAPCLVDFTADPNNNGKAGPVVVTTPVKVQAWTASGGGTVLIARDMAFNFANPRPWAFSTKGDMNCSWEIPPPTLYFESGGTGGTGGSGGSGGTGGSGGGTGGSAGG